MIADEIGLDEMTVHSIIAENLRNAGGTSIILQDFLVHNELSIKMILLKIILLLSSTHLILVRCSVEQNIRDAVLNTVTVTPEHVSSTRDPIRPDMHLYEKFLKNITSTAIKKALPAMMRIMDKVNMSSGCLSSLFKYVISLKQIKVWAMRMFDATAKVPSGMFDGTVTEFGAFDQCLKILVKNKKGVEDFRGQYCSVEAVPNLGPRPQNLSLAILPTVKFDDSIIKEMHSTIFAFYQLTLRFGICIPSTCTVEDMRVLGAQVVKPLNYNIRVSKCHVYEEIVVKPMHVIVLVLLSLLLLLVIGGTITEWNIKRRLANGISTKDSSLRRILLAFSLTTNMKKLCSTESSTDEMKSLHGIRALSMTWVILGHTYVWINFQALRKTSVASDWFNDLEFEVILNGWLSVSSFIFLSGLLTTHTTIKYMNKTGGKLNIFLYTVRRFMRLYPSLLLLLGAIFFLPWIASGPFWPELPGVEVTNCHRYWWRNLLFINNWTPIKEICMQHSWYISADMQLHIIALLILIPLYSNPYVGFAVCFVLSLAGSLTIGVLTYVRGYDPAILLSTASTENVYRIIENIHIKTFTYFGPYCIGVITGYLLLKLPKLKFPTSLNLIGWCCASVLGISSLYGTHRWNTGYFHEPEVTATYAALHRTTFTIAVAWVAFVCVTGNAELISSFLKCRPFILMSRLSFMAYMAQGPVIWTRYGSLKERIFFSHFNMLYEYMGNLVISLTLAVAGHLLVEAPFANLERLLFMTSPSKKKPRSNLCQVKTNQDMKCDNGISSVPGHKIEQQT
ncbi:nose resistant to fluoxetine protein 6-like [Uloborus diversus]|uniref:nose resistant to fluoxetine protein 6-like n=1 Tax=Uloborus diversus TaxID=327109 RepID=UPI00240906EB|nr:nose resistant to fluoxetine protein 6-like [Uloborus diversus]